jgi:peptidoglycan/xylan/chitin deacetylase (PgdA/CDA1 family)
MKRMDLRLKTLLANSLEKTGLIRLAELGVAPRQPVIFMLHRVLLAEEASRFYNPYLAITPQSFENFLSFLSQQFRVQTLAELVGQLHSGVPVGLRACALTFDDGWEDNYRIAWPILRRFGMPATIFVTTGLAGTSELLPEDKLWRYWQEAKAKSSLPAFDGVLESYRGAQRVNVESGFPTYRTVLKQLPGKRRLRLFVDLESEFGALPQQDLSSFMTWSQLKELSEDRITLGSHTVTHPSLAYEEDSVIREELGGSKRMLEQQIGRRIDYLAYPTGIFDERVTREAAATGYTAAVTTESRAVASNANPLLLPRIAVDNAVVNDAHGRFSAARTRLHILRAGSVS